MFVISDTHFGHKNMLNFKQPNGEPVRAFESVEEMDDYMVAQWNSVVGPKDRVYHLGDVAINRACIKTVARCNGKKILIKGNHDIFKLADYAPYFEDIRAYKVFHTQGILSHIPLHPSQLERFPVNVHGHLHCHEVGSPNYRNVCVEKVNYTPQPLELIFSSYGS